VKLIGIAFSHYVEKARWALDRYGVAYEEDRYMPTFHLPAVAWATRGRGGAADRVSSRFSTPVLLRDDGAPLRDSSDIVRWVSDTYACADDSLFPDAFRDDIIELDAYLSMKLGPHTRRAVYNQGLADPGLMRRVAQRNVRPGQARLFSAVFPVARAIIVKALRVTPERSRRSVEKVRSIFDEIEELRGGRPFLFGDRLSAADVTFACMAAPILMPPPEVGYGASLPSPDEMSPEAIALIMGFRQHPAGQFAMSLFRDYRQVRLP
jgi:glutathione S-transferase